MEKRWVIYGLVDPRVNEVRYVGKTSQTLENRLKEHLKEARLLCKTHKHRALKCIINSGLTVEIIAIESGRTDWAERERWWIAFYRLRGIKLWNSTEGGEGVDVSSEKRRQMGRTLSQTLSRLTPEERSLRSKRSRAGITPERLTAIAKKIIALRSPEQRVIMATKASHAMTTVQRSRAMSDIWTGLTSEQRTHRIKNSMNARCATNPVELICARCHNLFKVKPCRKDKAKYCSNLCRYPKGDL